jgi:hypothetical protein
MKKIAFMAIMIAIMLSSSVIAQHAELQTRVITSKDTTYFPMSASIDVVTRTVLTPAEVQDSLKKCIQSGKWYAFKAEYSSNGIDNWTQYPIPVPLTDYDFYRSDSAWTCHGDGTIYFWASYTIDKNAQLIQLVNGVPITPIQILELTPIELKISYCYQNVCLRVTQRHTILPSN